MLTVLAITSVLLGIIIIPMVQGFNFTRAAEGFAAAQERGRELIEQITRSIENSAGVRDNDGYKGELAIVVPDMNGTLTTVMAQYAKLDIFQPAKGDPSNVRNGAYVDPDSNIADPTAKAPKGQVNLPVAPGLTLQRYFICLNRPLDDTGLNPGLYQNPYVDYKRTATARWMASAGGVENLYVLRRADVQPMVFVGGTFVVNTKFFADDNGDGLPDLDDPYFMTLDAPGAPVLTAPQRTAKIARIKNWLSNSTVVTETRRFDMIAPLYDKSTRMLLSNGTQPRISTLIQFRPTSVTNEPATGGAGLALGSETDAGKSISPDMFRTKFGSWSAAVVRMYPKNYDPANANANDYLIGRFDSRAGTRTFRVYRYDPDSDVDNDDRNGDTPDIELFDVGAYFDQIAQGKPYPLTHAAAASNGRSAWASNAVSRAKFLPYIPDLTKGRLLTSFGIDQWGDVATVVPRPDNNLPAVQTGPELTPTTDGTPGGNFYDAAYQNNMNRLFNKVYADNPSLRVPGGVHRFIYLPITPQADGTASPMDPDPTVGFAQARIVPSSEIVMGPDQNPGPGYGQQIRYVRVTRNPGVNQYKINYVDLPEPDWAQLGYAAPPANYTPTDFVSAILQPRFKAGYIQFNSDPNVPLPDITGTGATPITVFYKFQFSAPGDTLTVDYDTRQLMSILLTIRNYPQSNPSPNAQVITLQGSAPIRNSVR